MANRKISESLNLRINLGNFNHIEFIKYAEESIDFSSDAERIGKETQLHNDLWDSMMQSVADVPNRLGRSKDMIQEVEERIKNKIPEWLENGPIPNLSNQNSASKREIQVAALQQDVKDTAVKMINIALMDDKNPKKRVELGAMIAEARKKEEAVKDAKAVPVEGGTVDAKTPNMGGVSFVITDKSDANTPNHNGDTFSVIEEQKPSVEKTVNPIEKVVVSDFFDEDPVIAPVALSSKKSDSVEIIEKVVKSDEEDDFFKDLN